METIEIGIALSGGGARGIAHIGVLQALEEYNINISSVAGTSMGAIVGVLYSAGFSAQEIADLIKTEKIYNWFKLHWFKAGLLSLEGVKEILEKHIGHNDFANLKKPFTVAVSNLNSGKGEIISHGNQLLNWVIASASVPILFTPVEINGAIYVDGGLFHNLPAESLLGKAEFIIGSNVNPMSYDREVSSAKEVGERVFNLCIAQNVWQSRTYCDFFIEPRDITQFSPWEYNKIDELIEVGYCAAKKVIETFIVPDLKIKLDLQNEKIITK